MVVLVSRNEIAGKRVFLRHGEPAGHRRTGPSQAIRGAAAVVGVIALVLALLVLGVYAVVTLDLMPLMR